MTTRPDDPPSPAAQYLAEREMFGIKLGLETMRALLEGLGHPERACPCLLIAGTNGKGSVAAYVEAGLRAAGLRTGLYTSPHLIRINERFAVGGHPIDDSGLESAVAAVRDAASSLVASGSIPAHPTYFEAVTAAAFHHFRRAGVEVAVLEVGLGGRLDATNASDPIASAIVSIDHDHQIHLGHTLPEIAIEKAGVLRPGRVCVLGGMDALAREAIARRAQELQALLLDAGEGVTGDSIRISTPEAAYDGLRPLPGAHQRGNLIVALRLLEAARAAGLPFDVPTAAAGTAGARWPGRLQSIAGDPPLLLDGAHNAAGARALAAHLASLGEPLVLLFGAMADKDVEAMAAALFPLAQAVVLTRASRERAASAEELGRRTGRLGELARRDDHIPSALDLARDLAHQRGATLVVAGSLYLVGAVLARLERD